MVLFSCNTGKRLYIANQTGEPIRLTVNSSLVADEGTVLAAFRDSLNGKEIGPGHLIIRFGGGQWQRSDEVDLKTLLQHISYTKGGSPEIYHLPSDLTIGRGTFIQELIVKIKA